MLIGDQKFTPIMLIGVKKYTGDVMDFLLYGEISILCMTLLGIMAYRASKFGIDTNRKKRAFITSICFAISMNFFDLLWDMAITETVFVPVWLRYVINACYFTSLAFSAFYWFIFSEIVHTKKFNELLLHILFLVPMVTLVALLLTTHRTGLLYKFTEDGKYVRGPLFYLQFAPALLYVLVASVKNLLYTFSPDNFERKETFVTMFSYSIPVFFCAVLQFLFQDLPILSTAPTISLLLVYTNSLRVQLSIDPLTGIYNRKRLIDTFSDKAKNIKKNKKLYFIFIDIDNFKTLNDKYGHNEGDKALQLVAETLNSICTRTGGTCARYGGDEFAVLQELDANESISDLCDEIINAVKERNQPDNSGKEVNVSVGYSEFDKDAHTVSALIRFADKQMYANKKKKN